MYKAGEFYIAEGLINPFEAIMGRFPLFYQQEDQEEVYQSQCECESPKEYMEALLVMLLRMGFIQTGDHTFRAQTVQKQYQPTTIFEVEVDIKG